MFLLNYSNGTQMAIFAVALNHYITSRLVDERIEWRHLK
jgi:hypothetical protein